MSYRIDKQTNELVIEGWEKGIAQSPYTGIANIRNLNTSYYSSVAYVNYRRQQATVNETDANWYAGSHSVNVSNNNGWTFTAPVVTAMANPVQQATSPSGVSYVLDENGNIWQQSAANSSTFNLLQGGSGRVAAGNGGLAYWNNYLVVFGAGAIEFCGDGTGDTEINRDNWNKSTPSTAIVTVAFSNAPFRADGVTHFTFNSGPTSGSTTGTLVETWPYASGAYSVQFSNGGSDIRVVTFTKASASISWSVALTGTSGVGFNMYQLQFTSSAGFSTFYKNEPVVFSSTGTLPSPLVAGTTYYLTANVIPTNGPNGIFNISTTQGGDAFFFTSDSSAGTMTMVDNGTPLPILNNANLSFSWGSYAGASTTATLTNIWMLPTGIYNIVDPLGNSIQAQFTYASTAITFVNPTVSQPTGTYTANILNPSATSYRAYVSKVDGNLYFANGRWLGRLSTSSNVNAVFNPAQPGTYSVNYAATGTLQPLDSIVDMVDLRSNLMILGNYDIYPWDYVSAQPTASSPVGEQTHRIVNLLNNIYISAGTKGNLYILNGYSAQLLYKLPDYIAGVIDPIWKWGDFMVHRSKLWFQALAQTSAGTNVLAGIFSLLVSPGMFGEQATGLVMEAQNSQGLTPTAGSKQNGILIDNEQWSTGPDSYYSAYSTSSAAGTIDYNDSSAWQNNEALIETDIIPIGSILDKKTFGQISFKLDRPMASGDSISMSWRPSLTDTYTAIGTTTAQVLSDYKPSNISRSQWAQFEVTFKCASSGTSFIPLREIRIQII